MAWIKIFNSEKEALATLSLNDLRKVTFEDTAYCLTRTTKGIFVTSDACSHDNASLSAGKCTTNGTIECPWHHYLFDPASGKCINHQCTDLQTFTVRVDEEGVFFNIE